MPSLSPASRTSRSAPEPTGARLDVLLSVLRERGQPYSFDQAAAIVSRLAETVESVHRQGRLHGDIRPSNIRMIDMLQPVLAGTGSECLCEAGACSHASALSPEQMLHNPIDARTDIFALGAVLYEMLLGRPALGPAENTPQYLHACATLTAPVALDPNVPAALSAIVMRAMKPLPHQRYARAIDMSIDLQRHLTCRNAATVHQAAVPPAVSKPVNRIGDIPFLARIVRTELAHALSSTRMHYRKPGSPGMDTGAGLRGRLQLAIPRNLRKVALPWPRRNADNEPGLPTRYGVVTGFLQAVGKNLGQRLARRMDKIRHRIIGH